MNAAIPDDSNNTNFTKSSLLLKKTYLTQAGYSSLFQQEEISITKSLWLFV